MSSNDSNQNTLRPTPLAMLYEFPAVMVFGPQAQKRMMPGRFCDLPHD
jgi:hypothetical protein